MDLEDECGDDVSLTQPPAAVHICTSFSDDEWNESPVAWAAVPCRVPAAHFVQASVPFEASPSVCAASEVEWGEPSFTLVAASPNTASAAPLDDEWVLKLSLLFFFCIPSPFLSPNS